MRKFYDTNSNTEENKKKYIRYVPLPVGYKDTPCTKCGSLNLTGVLITETADEQDPNIICKDCGYWFD